MVSTPASKSDPTQLLGCRFAWYYYFFLGNARSRQGSPVITNFFSSSGTVCRILCFGCGDTHHSPVCILIIPSFEYYRTSYPHIGMFYLYVGHIFCCCAVCV